MLDLDHFLKAFCLFFFFNFQLSTCHDFKGVIWLQKKKYNQVLFRWEVEAGSVEGMTLWRRVAAAVAEPVEPLCSVERF